MDTTSQPSLTLGLFEKRIDGDDCLLDLARLRFSQAGMGAEMHAGTPEHLEWLLRYRPGPEAAVALHLPRDFNLTDPDSRQRIGDFAERFAGRIHGMIIHDHEDLSNHAGAYRTAASELNARLQKVDHCPFLFVEYAAGLEPEVFADFFSSIRALDRVSACIDVGHVGVRQARKTFERLHPGKDVCELKSEPSSLPPLMSDVETAVQSALPTVLDLIESIAALRKPMHFHLHDGHPLSNFSPFGVSDHLTFQAEIPLGFEFRGRRSVPPMFGRDGLSRIVATTLKALDGVPVSFNLEIHPPEGYLALRDAAGLFHHWRAKTNAERMNHWLSVLAENHGLLREAIRHAGSAKTAASGRLD